MFPSAVTSVVLVIFVMHRYNRGGDRHTEADIPVHTLNPGLIWWTLHGPSYHISFSAELISTTAATSTDSLEAFYSDLRLWRCSLAVVLRMKLSFAFYSRSHNTAVDINLHLPLCCQKILQHNSVRFLSRISVQQGGKNKNQQEEYASDNH